MECGSTAPDPARLERLIERVDRMLASGRLTADEGERLRAASDLAGAEKVLREVRARHAGERLDVAVAEGAMTRHQADDILERVRGGEHSRRLRSRLARHRGHPTTNLGFPSSDDRPT